MPTDELFILVEKMAGKDPCEPAAITLSEASKMAASIAKLGRAFAGRLKVPNENVNSVLAEISAPKKNSISEDVSGLTREEEMMLVTP